MVKELNKILKTMKKIFEKIKTWWKSLPFKTKRGIKIASYCVGMMAVFFTLIYLFGIA